MRKRFIGGNWKMHGTKSSVHELVTGLKEGIIDNQACDVAVFPPYIFIEQVARILQGSVIQWGGQNLADAKEGAFTGEISGSMLKEFACEYVLVGHSERRQIYKENNDIVAKKCQLAQEIGLTPILCVGESLQERENNTTEQVIAEQLDSVLSTIELSKLIIAYEPIWAIGTGKTASPEQAQMVHQFIRGKIFEIDQDIGENLRIIYGGSVKSNNAKALFGMPDIDGGLVGGASLQVKEFIGICSCNNY